LAISSNVWNEIFNKDGHVFQDTHRSIPAFVRLLQEIGGDTVLDLGCGTGRHVVYLAQQGLRVFGFDYALTGLRLTQAWLASENLQAVLHQQNMYDPFPYPNNLFDGIISIQVIHHGRLEQIQKAAKELQRVLKPGGVLLVTVPFVSRSKFPSEEIEASTFVPLDGYEKGLPHHIFSSEGLKSLFSQCDLLGYYVDGDVHQAVLAQKR
jgi:SAM-dependent methyltransferase